MKLITILMLTVASSILAQNAQVSSENGDAKQKAVTRRLPGERMTDAQRQALAALGSDISLAFSSNEIPSSLMGPLTSRVFPEDAAAEADAVLRTYGAAFRMSAADGFVFTGLDVDKSGVTHVRMGQTRQGAPVSDRELVVHMDTAFVRGISGNFLPDLVAVDPPAAAKRSAHQAAALSGPIASNHLLNPGFESGTANWLGQTYTWVGGTYGGGYTSALPICGGATISPAHSGRYCACLGGNGRLSTEWIGQTITIPSAAVSGTLSFWLRVVTSEAPTPYDFLRIEIWNATGTAKLATLPASFANNSGYTSWQDVSMPFPVSYRGTAVQVRLVASEDPSIATTFHVDDVALTFAGLSL